MKYAENQLVIKCIVISMDFHFLVKLRCIKTANQLTNKEEDSKTNKEIDSLNSIKDT